jgi:hypothetical protein
MTSRDLWKSHRYKESLIGEMLRYQQTNDEGFTKGTSLRTLCENIVSER